MGFFSRLEYWSALPISPPGDLPDPRISCIGRQILYHCATWEALDEGEMGLIRAQWNQSGMMRCPEPSNTGKLLLLLGPKGLPEPGNNRLQGVAHRSREGAGGNKDPSSLPVSLLVSYENSLANPTRGLEDQEACGYKSPASWVIEHGGKEGKPIWKGKWGLCSDPLIKK